MRTHCEIVPVQALKSSCLEQMWQLFTRFYSGVTREIFERDLLIKHQALIFTVDEKIVGFTSQLFREIDSHRVTYSGDIIIEPGFRGIGTTYFFHRWAKTVWKRCDWWCLLSSGPRTFRIPYTFYKRVTPNQDGDERAEEQKLRHRFAESLYGKSYDRYTGIVKLDHPYQQKNEDKNIRSAYPMNQFFDQANPGWHEGDELVSLISLKEENWKPIAMRMLHWKNSHG